MRGENKRIKINDEKGGRSVEGKRQKNEKRQTGGTKVLI